MKKKVLEITCDRCPRHVEIQPGHMRDFAKSGWLKTSVQLIGKSGPPLKVDLCPVHARPMLKALVKIDPDTLEV